MPIDALPLFRTSFLFDLSTNSNVISYTSLQCPFKSRPRRRLRLPELPRSFALQVYSYAGTLTTLLNIRNCVYFLANRGAAVAAPAISLLTRAISTTTVTARVVCTSTVVCTATVPTTTAASTLIDINQTISNNDGSHIIVILSCFRW